MRVATNSCDDIFLVIVIVIISILELQSLWVKGKYLLTESCLESIQSLVSTRLLVRKHLILKIWKTNQGVAILRLYSILWVKDYTLLTNQVDSERKAFWRLGLKTGVRSESRLLRSSFYESLKDSVYPSRLSLWFYHSSFWTWAFSWTEKSLFLEKNSLQNSFLRFRHPWASKVIPHHYNRHFDERISVWEWSTSVTLPSKTMTKCSLKWQNSQQDLLCQLRKQDFLFSIFSFWNLVFAVFNVPSCPRWSWRFEMSYSHYSDKRHRWTREVLEKQDSLRSQQPFCTDTLVMWASWRVSLLITGTSYSVTDFTTLEIFS